MTGCIPIPAQWMMMMMMMIRLQPFLKTMQNNSKHSDLVIIFCRLLWVMGQDQGQDQGQVGQVSICWVLNDTQLIVLQWSFYPATFRMLKRCIKHIAESNCKYILCRAPVDSWVVHARSNANLTQINGIHSLLSMPAWPWQKMTKACYKYIYIYIFLLTAETSAFFGTGIYVHQWRF